MKKIFIIAVLLVLLSSFVSADLTTNNILYWSFDNANLSAGSILDSSGNGRNGSYSGVTTGVAGIINEQFTLSSGDKIVSDTFLERNDDFTVCAWIKNSVDSELPLGFGNSFVHGFIFGEGGGICGTPNKISYGYHDGDWKCVTDTDTYSTSIQYFVCGVVNPSTSMSIFVNGVNKTSLAISTAGALTRELNIGDVNSDGWAGDIDEVAVWSRLLTEDEISELYNSGNGFNPYGVLPLSVSFHKVKIVNNWTGSNLVGVNVSLNNSLWNLTQADGVASFINLSGSFNYIASLSNYFNVSGVALENQTVNNDMFQSQINLSVTELFTGNPVNNVSIYVNGSLVINTTSYWGLIYPNVGSYVVTNITDNSGEDVFHVTNTSFSVAAFDNKTHTVRVHQHVINVTAKNVVGNASIDNFSLFVEDLSIGSNRTFNTTVGWVIVPVIHDLYNVSIFADGFATNDNNEVFNISGDVNHTFFLFEGNSISFTIFDLDNLTLVNVTIDIEMIGATITYDLNATNGTAFISDLNNDTYQITFTGSGYDPTILFATITGGDHLDIIAFMADNGIVDFIVQNQLGDLQGNVTLTFTQLVNGSFVTVGQVITDFSGRGSIFLDSTTRYTFFAVKDGFSTFTGEVLPTQSRYTIVIQDLGVDRFVSIFDDLRVDTTFSYVPLSGNAFANLVLNSASGRLEFYGMNSTYNGTNYFVNTSGFPAGGIETFNISNIDPVVEPIVFINYWFKYIDHPLQEWNATYLVSDVVPTNITIEAGLFDDLEALDRANPIRGLMGAFIIIALILLFSTSRDMTITSIGGIIGLGINWKFSLMPQTLLSVSMIVLVILIIADNIGGGR